MPPAPPPGWQPPPRPPGSGDGALIAGMAAAGAAIFITVNAVAGFVVFLYAIDSSDTRTAQVVVGIGAALSVLAAFGGGTVLILTRKPVGKGLGMGLMIGWALVTICTVGFCTGVNPQMYSSSSAVTSGSEEWSW